MDKLPTYEELKHDEKIFTMKIRNLEQLLKFFILNINKRIIIFAPFKNQLDEWIDFFDEYGINFHNNYNGKTQGIFLLGNFRLIDYYCDYSFSFHEIKRVRIGVKIILKIDSNYTAKIENSNRREELSIIESMIENGNTTLISFNNDRAKIILSNIIFRTEGKVIVVVENYEQYYEWQELLNCKMNYANLRKNINILCLDDDRIFSYKTKCSLIILEDELLLSKIRGIRMHRKVVLKSGKYENIKPDAKIHFIE